MARARTNLMLAFAQMNLEPRWIEREKSWRGNPAYVRRYGSPAVLVNGHDIVTGDQDAAPRCRLYYSRDGVPGGVPDVDLIRSGLAEYGMGRSSSASDIPLRHTIVAMPGIAVALLPKLACPLCWPAYAALLSTLGLGFLLTSTALFWVTCVFLLGTVLMLAAGSRKRRVRAPAILAILAAAAILGGKFVFESSLSAYAGVALLVFATLWNAWRGGSPSAASADQRVS